MPRVSPNVVVWARETAGLSLPEAAQRLGFRDNTRGTAAEKLARIEAGRVEPSRPQLLKMAKAYRRPLITFYLPSPPAVAAPIEDYRTLPRAPADDVEGNLKALVRDVRARQEEVRELLEEEEAAPVALVGSVALKEGARKAAATISQHLGWTLQGFRGQNGDSAFDHLRRLAERVGVFVLLIGNLGSHHSAFDVKTFRGFALADPLAPFVVINDQDARAAWSFTLLHELAHLALGLSGISGAVTEGDVERFCNDVASAILLPQAELAPLAAVALAAPDLKIALGDIATPRRVSRSLVAYRMYLAGLIDRRVWESLNDAFEEEYRRSRAARREAASSGPDYYTVRRHRVGSALLGLVKRSMDSGFLTPARAGRILGVKARTVAPLVEGRAA